MQAYAKVAARPGVPVLLGDLDACDLHGGTPLMASAACPCPEAVTVLLAAGADPNAETTRPFPGVTALHEAAKSGCTASIDALLRAGARVDAANGIGKTALACAAERGIIGVLG